MKTDRIHEKLISRGFFILAVLSAVSLLSPASYSADRNDEALISLPEKKPATTKPRITTQKKETPAQSAEPAKPASRQSLLGGKNSEPDPAATEPAKNGSGRSGLMRGGGTGRKKTDGEEEQPERDPSLTKTVTRWSEGTTDYETTTEYDGDRVVETQITTEHNRGMIVETTVVTETLNGKVVRKSKNKTTRKEGAASASTDKQSKTLLGRANDLSNSRTNGDVQAAQNSAATAKPASTANTAKAQTQTTGNNTAKPAPAGNTAKTTTAKGSAATPQTGTEEDTPVVAVEEKKEPEPVEESVPAEETTKETEPVSTATEPESPAESDETVPDDDKKEPDSDRKSGTLSNPFGVVRPMDGKQED